MPWARTLYSLIMQDPVNTLEQCKIQTQLSNGQNMYLPSYAYTEAQSHFLFYPYP